MVSVFEGQLSRTWFFNRNNRTHVIGLYHDTITGVRTAMLDFQDIPGSEGNSSLLMDGKGHRIFFTVDGLPAYIEIKRSGWTGFAYACVINDVRISEATETVAMHQEAVYNVKIVETTLTEDEMSADYPIIWFRVKCERIKDKAVTHVHRRFREFAELNSQVKQNFKGHHLRAALPPFPDKTPKALVNYQDPEFIRERQLKLEQYLQQLLAIPHVSEMVCVKAFVGLMSQVREFSVSFHTPTLGLTLQPSSAAAPSAGSGSSSSYTSISSSASSTAVLVGSVQKPELCESVRVGDALSKLNGVPIGGMAFSRVVQRIKSLSRPLVVHFIQVIDNTHGEGFSAGEEEKSEESNALLAHAHALNAQTYAQQHTDTQTHTHSQQREPDGYVSLSAARPPHSHAQPHAHTQAHKTKLRSTAEDEDEEVPDELVDLSAPHSAPTQHTLNALPSAAAPQQQEDGEWNTFTPSSPHSPHTPTQTQAQTQAHTEGETAAHVSVAQKHSELFGEGETRSAAPIGWD